MAALLVLLFAGASTIPDYEHTLVHTEPDEMAIWESTVRFPEVFGWNYDARIRPLTVVLGHSAVRLGAKDLSGPKTVSWVAYLVIGAGLFFVGRQVSVGVGLAATVLFLAAPSSVFYAHAGIGDMLLSGWILAFLVAWSRVLKNPSVGSSLLAGAFVGAAMATKEQAIILLALPLPFLAKGALGKGNGVGAAWRRFWRQARSQNYLAVDSRPLLAYLAAILLFAPIALYVAGFDARGYALTWLRQFATHTGPGVLAQSPAYLTSTTLFWLPLPFLLLAVGGIAGLIGCRDRGLGLIGFVGLASPFLFLQSGLLPRYLVQWMPVWSLCAAYGAEQAARWLAVPWKVAGTAPWRFAFTTLVVAAAIGPALPAAAKAYAAGRSQWFQDTVAWLTGDESCLGADNWLFSNYWPQSFRAALGRGHATWLTMDQSDAEIFSVEGVVLGASDIAPPGLPLDVLATQGGVVVWLDEGEHGGDPSPPYRREAMGIVRSRYNPRWLWVSPHEVPPGTILPTRVSIYCVPADSQAAAGRDGDHRS